MKTTHKWERIKWCGRWVDYKNNMNLCEQRNLEKITQIGIEENFIHNFEKKPYSLTFFCISYWFLYSLSKLR